jgi:hypothetical protein
MSGEQAKATAIHGGPEQLRGQLRDTVEMVRRLGGGVVFERFPGALQEESPSDGAADGLDARRVGTAPDVAAVAHRSLVDAADDLAGTLAQLERTGWRAHPLRSGRGTP